MADTFNLWDELAIECLERPAIEGGHKDMKARTYRLIMGMESSIDSLDNAILRFLRLNHLAIMAVLVQDDQVTEEMRKAPSTS